MKKSDSINISIETDNLSVRPFSEADQAELFTLLTFEGLGEALGISVPATQEDCLPLIQKFISGGKTFALQLKAEQKLIGSVSVLNPPASLDLKWLGKTVKYVEILLAADQWGKGLFAEALTALKDYLLNSLDCTAVLCGHISGNAASREIILSCGFEYYAEEKVTLCGKEEDAVYYAFIKK